MNSGAIVLVLVLVLIALAYYFLVMKADKTPEQVCGTGYEAKAGSTASAECMRSIWLNTGCTKNGIIWKTTLADNIDDAVFKKNASWWLARPTIKDIETDMKAYYTLASSGKPVHKLSCGF